jgi:MFS family permease
MSQTEKIEPQVAVESPTPAGRVFDDSTPPFDPIIEKRILRKLDFRLVPMLWILFLVSFVDRGNIGNAKIQGMTESLHLTGDKYNIAVMVFTLAYITFGVPANMLVKKLGPRTLPAMMFIWGLFAMVQGFTKTWGGLVACRFLMGKYIQTWNK